MKSDKNNKIFIRTSTNDIGDLVTLLYEKVLLFCESDEIKKIEGRKITEKVFTKNINGQITLIYNTTKPPFKKSSRNKIIDKTVDVKTLNNTIYYVPTKNKLVSLLKHLRNAFAHNLVIVNNDSVIIGDFLKNSDKPTMLGKLSKKNLKLLINTIYLLKKT